MLNLSDEYTKRSSGGNVEPKPRNGSKLRALHAIHENKETAAAMHAPARALDTEDERDLDTCACDFVVCWSKLQKLSNGFLTPSL